MKLAPDVTKVSKYLQPLDHSIDAPLRVANFTLMAGVIVAGVIVTGVTVAGVTVACVTVAGVSVTLVSAAGVIIYKSLFTTRVDTHTHTRKLFKQLVE